MADKRALICEVWTDHVWAAGRLLATGKHPQKGFYQHFESSCTRCGRITVETHWLDVPVFTERATKQGTGNDEEDDE